MIGIDITGAAIGELSASDAAAVFSAALAAGQYEVFADNAKVYVKILKEGEAEASFAKAYPLWLGNSRTFIVPNNGKIGVICASGEAAITVQYHKVWPTA